MSDIERIRHLAMLSGLALSEEELSEFDKDLENMLEFVERIRLADENEQSGGGAFSNYAELREDEEHILYTKDEITGNSKTKLEFPRMM